MGPRAVQSEPRSVPQSASPIPALLAPFTDPRRVRTDYPLLLVGGGPLAEGGLFADEGRLEPAGAIPLARWLQEACEQTDAPSVFRDNLPRLERAVAGLLTTHHDAEPVLTRAALQVAEALALAPTPDATLRRAAADLVKALPSGSRLVAYHPRIGLDLLAHAARSGLASRRAAVSVEATELRNHLSELLTAEHARGAVGLPGLTDGVFDTAALRELLGPHRGTVPLPADTLAAAERTLAGLERGLAGVLAGPLLIAVGPEEWSAPGCEVSPAAEPLAAADACFDARATEVVALTGAMRAARLLLGGTYAPDRHDAQVAALDWRDLRAVERDVMPRVAAVLSAPPPVARLLEALCGPRPLQILVEVEPASLPSRRARLELARQGVATGQAFVQQSTPARAAHLLDGFARALRMQRPGLHLLCTGNALSPVGPWMFASAAIEGRAHPLMTYDPDAGSTWAATFDASANPQSGSAWPAHPSADGPSADGEPAARFTFADFALLDPSLTDHFRLANAGEELVPIAAWLESPSTALPVVEAVSEAGPVKLVVSRRLVAACRERQRTWRALAELGGIGNAHAEAAATAAAAEARAQALESREALEEQHARALEEVRDHEAGRAMERLTSVLIGGDLERIVGGITAPRAAAWSPDESASPAGSAPAASPGSVAESEPATAAPTAAKPAAPPDEPWVDSPLCTSCNDCVEANGILFVYDDDKQAMIGDPRAGTFAEIVAIAEKCPARCIHPGAPLNPDEPGLEELIARAAPLQ